MRVCWTILRSYEKKHGKLVREDLIEDLKDMGLPEDIANQLLASDFIKWEGTVDETETFVGLNILD